MTGPTLSDADHLDSANIARAHAGQVASKTSDPVFIDGILDDEGLTVLLRCLDSKSAPSKRFCVRLNGAELRTTGDIPGHAYGFCDVLAGETNEGLKLVIESHRCYTSDLEGNVSALKRFHRHAFICSGLSHSNIVPFLGVFSCNQHPYACVFESVGEEHLQQYLINNPGTSRLKLLTEVARGLHHIHDLDIVHGSIKGTNIRVNDQGTARIAGFACATLLLGSDITSEDVNEPAEFNVSRWCSPEILHPEGFGFTKAKSTKASDVYAFAMLAYEIFSGRLPFQNKKETAVVVTVITSDERPPRPAHPQLSDELWEMIEKCWRRDPSQRPTIQEIVDFLEK